MDQISQLPDPLLQHILFFLPAKDAAQTSVLSKTWLKVWNLLPVFTFDFDQNLSLRKLLSTENDESEQADVRDAFNTFNVEELNGTLSCPLSIVKHMKIEQVKESLNFETLLDGLFWTCHPETLSIVRIWARNEDFIQFLREKLMQRDIVPVCCESRRVKCWRHYLKETEVENSTRRHGDPSFSSRVSTICFKLTW